MNIIFYQVKTQYSNAGDALINRALIEELRNHGDIYANCKGVPKKFIEELGIEKEEKLSFREASFCLRILKCAIESIFRKNKVYIFSGLGDMHGGSKKRAIKNIISGVISGIYRVFGVKTIRIGRSIGVITKDMKISEKIRDRFTTYSFVRDSISLETCKRMGSKKAEFCPDMSWLYKGLETPKQNENTNVMLNFKETSYGEKNEEYTKTLIEKIDLSLKALTEKLGTNLKITIAYQVEADQTFSSKLYEELKERYDVVFNSDRIHLDTAEKIYCNFSYHLSNRLHSILLGHKYGSLPIALLDKKNHLKISALMQDCELDDLMIDIFTDNVIEKVGYIVQNNKKLYTKLVKCEQEQRREIKKILKIIFRNKRN